MSKRVKKSMRSVKSDYILKVGLFLFFVGLIIMLFATYISFVNNENIQFRFGYQNVEV